MSMTVIENKAIISTKEIVFKNKIHAVVDMNGCYLFLLMDDVVPDHNIEAFDSEGNKLWDISEVIQLKYPEAYVSLNKTSESTVCATSYNGVRYEFDVFTKQIVGKTITK